VCTTNWASNCCAGWHCATPPAELAQILLFSRCDLLDSAQVSAGWPPVAVRRRTPARDRAGRHRQHPPNIDQPAFSAALARIHDYIAAGDTYQVNYTYRLRFDAFGSIYALYARLRGRQPVPYGALMRWTMAVPCCRCRRNCSCAIRMAC
jgi:para-aminobenzoate synthetase/4-amino-4-deoxychorismate lyase